MEFWSLAQKIIECLTAARIYPLTAILTQASHALLSSATIFNHKVTFDLRPLRWQRLQLVDHLAGLRRQAAISGLSEEWLRDNVIHSSCMGS